MDNIKNGLVNYWDFCEIVDEIFTLKGIDKDPLVKVQEYNPAITLAARRRYIVIFFSLIINYSYE
jgi:hypothetical protein